LLRCALPEGASFPLLAAASQTKYPHRPKLNRDKYTSEKPKGHIFWVDDNLSQI
jgi:hypothetical protein